MSGREILNFRFSLYEILSTDFWDFVLLITLPLLYVLGINIRLRNLHVQEHCGFTVIVCTILLFFHYTGDVNRSFVKQNCVCLMAESRFVPEGGGATEGSANQQLQNF